MNLYNIMRPKSFKEFLPTCDTIDALKHDTQNKVLKHTYLLHGPRGCGKSTLAKLIALSYDCSNIKTNGDNIPCGTCNSCKRNTSPYSNIMEVNAAKFRGIHDVGQLVDTYKNKGLFEGTIVIILNECHKLTSEAKEALLVPLEDPPSHLKWILTTTEPEKLGDALISRCQTHLVHRLSKPNMVQLLNTALSAAVTSNLVKASVEKTVKIHELGEKIYIASDGIPRTAIGMLEAYIASGLKEETLTYITMKADDELSEEERERFDTVLQLTSCNDIIEAAGIASKLIHYSGSCEGIRLGLIKYSITTLSSLRKNDPSLSERCKRGIQLLDILREPLVTIFPMRDLVCRLMKFISTKEVK